MNETENILLNDHCMIDIFDHLNPRDLISAARVSKQFNRLALYAFGRNFRECEIYKYFKSTDEGLVTSLFETFGHLISKLEMMPLCRPWYNSHKQSYAINLIKEHCTKNNNKLLELKISDFTNLNEEILLLNGIFENLEVLELKMVYLPITVLQLLKMLPNAKRVKLIHCIGACSYIEPRVEEFTHMKLEGLYLIHYVYVTINDLLSVIHVSFPNSVTLVLKGIWRNENSYIHCASTVGKLIKMKNLNIDFNYNDVDELIYKLLENNVKLMKLILSEVSISTNAINGLCKMQDITELYILNSYGISEASIRLLALSLRNLETLSIMENVISIRTLYGIVEGARKLTRAEFKIRSRTIFTISIYKTLQSFVKRQNKELQLCIHKASDFCTYRNELRFIELNQNPELIITCVYNGHNSILARNSY